MAVAPWEGHQWRCELCGELAVQLEHDGMPVGWAAVFERDVCEDCIAMLSDDSESSRQRRAEQPRNYITVIEAGKRFWKCLEVLASSAGTPEALAVLREATETLEAFCPRWEARERLSCTRAVAGSHIAHTEGEQPWCSDCGAFWNGHAWIAAKRAVYSSGENCPRCPVAGVCSRCGRHWTETVG